MVLARFQLDLLVTLDRRYRRYIREELNMAAKGRSKAEKVLILFIESGLLYCLSGVSCINICLMKGYIRQLDCRPSSQPDKTTKWDAWRHLQPCQCSNRGT